MKHPLLKLSTLVPCFGIVPSLLAAAVNLFPAQHWTIAFLNITTALWASAAMQWWKLYEKTRDYYVKW